MNKKDHQLLQQAIDGEMTAEEFSALQQRMREDPELVELYKGYASLQHTLSEEYEGGFPVSSAGGDFASRRVPRRLLMIAAALLLLGGGWWFGSKFRLSENDIATASFSLDAIWYFDGPNRSLGAATGVGEDAKLFLEQGRAAISLEPAVIAVVEGPAEVEFPEPGALHLVKGRGWFQNSGSGGHLSVSTPLLAVVDEGTEFAIDSRPKGPDQVYVIDGRVKVSSPAVDEDLMVFAGEMAAISADGAVNRSAAGNPMFPKSIGRFNSIISGKVEPSAWTVGYGSPVLEIGRVNGANFAINHRLESPLPSGSNGVLMVTIGVAKSDLGEFHTEGWAGMSFFSGETEMLFFGDSFGSKGGWSLDVKQGIPVIVPDQAVLGDQVITMRYESRTGEVSLHQGAMPLRPAFCRGKIPAGSRFDRFRIAASSGAAMTVNSLHVRSGG